jgi:hypothetical protein
MDDRQILRDRQGNKIGEVLISDRRCVLRDKFGNKLGDYNANDQFTRDRFGNIIGRGNLLATLLR